MNSCKDCVGRPSRRVNRHPITCSVCWEIIEKNDCICQFAGYQSHKKCESGLIDLKHAHLERRGIFHTTGE